MNWRWLLPAAVIALYVFVDNDSDAVSLLFIVLGLGAVAYAMSGAEYARNDHFVRGHKEGEVVPKEYRVVTRAEHEPIERPWPEPGRFSISGPKDEPERLTRYVSGELGPAILQHAGLVLYRNSEQEAREAASRIHALLDPIFPEPVQTRVERWNEDLDAWQPPELAGGDEAALGSLGWEARLTFAEKDAARAAAGRIRATGEVMVGWSRRHVTVATADESAARAVPIMYPELGGAAVRVRRLNPVTRRRLLATLYDRRSGTGGGWLTWDEPAPA
jgi:hypothetical protein